MKRSVALVLTIVIFAAIAVCFMRPDKNPDFGYADRFDGQRIPLKLEGDSEYFAESWIGGILPQYKLFYVTLRPKEPYSLTLGTPWEDKNGEIKFLGQDCGCIERRVGNKWEYYGSIWAKDGPLVQQIGYVGTGNSLNWDGGGLFGTSLDLDGSILYTPGEYRFTIKFHVALGLFEVEEEEHCVSFRYTVPKATQKPFDVLQVGTNIINNELNHNRHIATVVLRLNHGTPAPYILRDGKYYPPAWDGSIWYGNEPDWDGRTIVKYGIVSSEDYADECTETFHFAENSDGSGKQYDLTLNLRFK